MLFYDRGARDVSIEDVVVLAGTTRMTLYRHFPSKDDLVLAHLRRRAEHERTVLADVVRDAARDRRNPLLLLAARVRDDVTAPGFRGCPFLNAAAEYRDPEHPVRRLVAAHRAWFRTSLVGLVADTGAHDPEGIADRIVLLRDGAMAGGALGGASSPAGALPPAVAAVLGVRS
ncbi:helix-turn-helix transcriptional regulator [Cellulomonas wangleii]|uniref:Helix-turn-helix transcriptional regulator n=1 Tax=Cellulomonas wangleii TaxID=2816956 RepID=A0ABX8D919_9CELL|nr:helix-turn-helix transcriptional regulator [Cellulomonas wangleii]